MIPVLLQSYCKSYVVNVAISRDFEIRIQTVFQPAKTVKFNPSRFDLTKNLVFTDLEIQNTTSSLLRSKEFVLDNFKDEPNTKSWKNLTFLFI